MFPLLSHQEMFESLIHLWLCFKWGLQGCDWESKSRIRKDDVQAKHMASSIDSFCSQKKYKLNFKKLWVHWPDSWKCEEMAGQVPTLPKPHLLQPLLTMTAMPMALIHYSFIEKHLHYQSSRYAISWPDITRAFLWSECKYPSSAFLYFQKY